MVCSVNAGWYVLCVVCCGCVCKKGAITVFFKSFFGKVLQYVWKEHSTMGHTSTPLSICSAEPLLSPGLSLYEVRSITTEKQYRTVFFFLVYFGGFSCLTYYIKGTTG